MGVTSSLSGSTSEVITNCITFTTADNIITNGTSAGKIISWGFSLSPEVFGAMSPEAVPWNGRSPDCVQFTWNTSEVMIIRFNPSSGNADWISVDVGGLVTFVRTAGTYSVQAGGDQWTYASITTNPFGIIVGTKTAINWTV